MPGKDVLGVGGAMDLVVGARRVIVTMTATSSGGEPKVVPVCTYPLTAKAAVDVVITELSVFRVRHGGLVLVELLDARHGRGRASRNDGRFRHRPGSQARKLSSGRMNRGLTPSYTCHVRNNWGQARNVRA